MGRQGRLRVDDAQPCVLGSDSKGCYGRRYQSEGAPHGEQPTVEKGGPDEQRGCAIGRTKGGMNTKLHAVTDGKGGLIRFS